MLFIDWWQLGIFSFLLLLIAASAWSIYVTRNKRDIIQVPTVLLSTPVAGLAGLLLLFMVLGNLSGCDTYVAPAYSPDHRFAARVENHDEGATGGSSVVELYMAHGFRRKMVFYGGWKSVQNGDLIWRGDSDLYIRYHHYEGYDEAKACTASRLVRVHCVAK